MTMPRHGMKVSADTLRRNPGLAQQIPDLQVNPEDLVKKHAQHKEDEFQKTAERWLEHKGYLKLSKDNIADGAPPAGWQFHMHKEAAVGNYVMLDILLLRTAHGDYRWKWFELKAEKTRILKHQQQLVDMGNAGFYFSMWEFKEAVEAWEGKGQ